MEAQTETHLSKKPKISSSSTPPVSVSNSIRNPNLRTQLCRKFRQGSCTFGSKCNYAHSLADLGQSKLCRMFLHNTHCSYGHSCRFLHVRDTQPRQLFNTLPPPNTDTFFGKLDGYSSAEYRVTQTSTAAINVSNGTLATTSLHKNEPCGVAKFIFKKNEFQKISGIYADWI